jgi:hypothetical protein
MSSPPAARNSPTERALEPIQASFLRRDWGAGSCSEAGNVDGVADMAKSLVHHWRSGSIGAGATTACAREFDEESNRLRKRQRPAGAQR